VKETANPDPKYRKTDPRTLIIQYLGRYHASGRASNVKNPVLANIIRVETPLRFQMRMSCNVVRICYMKNLIGPREVFGVRL
jgi:hypothetical protein